MSASVPSWSSKSLSGWVEEVARLTRPDRIVWCDGSEDERRRLAELAVRDRVLIPLNETLRPGCYLHRSRPDDVGRIADGAFICTSAKEEAGPTNSWKPPDEAYLELSNRARDSMRGRTMYVVPYLMGPPNSEFSRIGVELTDSVYAVLGMRIMTRIGSVAIEALNGSTDFNHGIHCMLDLNPKRRLLCHFPDDDAIWSVGSNYGANALLSCESFGLRIASRLARKEGWLAEHMTILGLENPQGEVLYVAAAFPDGCGKTSLSMLTPPPSLGKWRVHTVGDNIAWLRIGKDGRLWAVNPEYGCFGAAPGTSSHSNRNLMCTLQRDTLFTNTALTRQNDVWWEGNGYEPPPGTSDWQGRPLTPGSPGVAAHSDSYFLSPISNNPVLSPHYKDAQGVPISVILFGARRSTTVPLIVEAFDWKHGVYLGASMGSEAPAVIEKKPKVRRDSMAMASFCGYDLGSYLGYWATLGRRLRRPPKVFMVNWFRKGADGSYLWPGYGENLRILQWIADRIARRVEAQETPLGFVPNVSDVNLEGLEFPIDRLRTALAINPDEWSAELSSLEQFVAGLSSDLPHELEVQHQATVAAFGL